MALAADHVIGRGHSGLPEAVLGMLQKRKQTVCTAESCTGGRIASMLTSVPGASASMWGGVVAYDNSVKQEILGVSPEALAEHGAVSEVVVKAMARGARKQLGTDWAVATSGVAGPSGGTEEKPVGMVWMAVAGPEGRTGVVPSVWFTTRAHCPAGVTPNFDPSSRSLARRWE